MASKRSETLKQKYATGEIQFYRDNKGRRITQEEFNKQLQPGEITYNPKRTNNPASITAYGKKYKINIRGKGTYQMEKITLESGKEIYLAYQSDSQREKVIKDILEHEISPKEDLNRHGGLNRNDKTQLRDQRYATSYIETIEYRDLTTFIAKGYEGLI